ncbi:DUF3152 domain-containing protein [Micromonospora siamensis]|uniref:DUF3152 domain-containing protein n=1 Tax=Micromonospora siamensis TaxID=299152 RepID=A0A1C5K6V9_9ACTN|nr:DUF3152 domain-containing protein [Micromonospora siamensis]SCG78543.1 Protein of unknown function [Micromonospora siamensis]
MPPVSPQGPAVRPDPPNPYVLRRRVRMRRRRRRTALIGLTLLGAAAVAGVTGDGLGGDHADPPAVAGPAPVVAGEGAGERQRPAGYPRAGSGEFVAAGGDSPVQGADGPLRRYRVAVERGVGQDPDAFAAEVDEVLGDPRSWIASGGLRVQRVADPEAADFTIYLATPDTSERMCAEGGLRTEGYTSCRLPGRVILNLARWMDAVPDYGAPLAVYRTYVINHEVGHQFGELHEGCPGPGRPAPVMQQQTYGLDGCVANAWPYLDGKRYAGEPLDGV